jgi:2-iminobutanoate/2-iminopropanoate deaminase
MKSAIRTNKAPEPAAAYAQAVTSGDLIFVSGQVATNPATGTIDGNTIEDQVTQVLRNIEAIVSAAGGSKESIVRCGVFLADLGDFAAMNRSYKEFFGDSLPARTTVQAGLGTLRVEIDAIAVLSKSRGHKGRSSARRKEKTDKRS